MIKQVSGLCMWVCRLNEVDNINISEYEDVNVDDSLILKLPLFGSDVSHMRYYDIDDENEYVVIIPFKYLDYYFGDTPVEEGILVKITNSEHVSKINTTWDTILTEEEYDKKGSRN